MNFVELVLICFQWTALTWGKVSFFQPWKAILQWCQEESDFSFASHHDWRGLGKVEENGNAKNKRPDQMCE